MHAIFLVWTCLLLSLLSGCASVDYTEYRQTVLVKTDPPGARIYEQGRELGVSPAYIRVRRQARPELTVKLHEASEKLKLKTHYRWRGSFWPNLVFGALAPAGWLIDWATGNIWSIEEPDVVALPNPTGRHFQDEVQSIAVAPVLAGAIDSSDALGEVIADRLRQATDAQVMHYEVTAPIFEYHGFGNGFFRDRKSKNDLFYELGADHIFVSEAEAGPQGFLVKGRLINVFTGRESMERSYEVVPKDAPMRQQYSTRQMIEKYFRFLPNTVLANLSSNFGSVTVGKTEYLATESGGASAADEAIRYISMLSLSHVDRPRENSRGHIEFEFVPNVVLSNKRVRFELYNELASTRFDRWYFGGGYGPELGYRWRANYLYTNFVPLWQWSRLEYSQDQKREAFSNWGVSLAFEIGYSMFLSDHFVFRFYSRSFSENTDLWKKAFTKARGSEVDLLSVDSTFTGIAFGYYFPSSLKRRESWRIRRR